tara:strand:- start:167 stop:508 length:342 start_codon:yes stop_codon:yes gene_type:complete
MLYNNKTTRIVNPPKKVIVKTKEPSLYDKNKGYLVPQKRSDDIKKHLVNTNPDDKASQEFNDGHLRDDSSEYEEYMEEILKEIGCDVDDLLDEEEDEEKLPDIYISVIPVHEE